MQVREQVVTTTDFRRMCRKHAVRGLVSGDSDLHWSEDLRRSLRSASYWALESLVQFDGSWFDFPENAIIHSDRGTRIEAAIGKANIDPFMLDAFDLLNFLLLYDPDHAEFPNDVGPGKTTSPEAHRLLAQISHAKKYNSSDEETLHKILSPERYGSNFGQFPRLLSEITGAEESIIDEILRDRHARGELFNSLRLESIKDDNYSFLDETFLWRSGSVSRVRANRNDREIYTDFRERASRIPSLVRHFRELEKHYDKYGTRVINGQEVRYPSLFFPSIPELDEELMAIAKRSDAIVCTSLSRAPEQNFIFSGSSVDKNDESSHEVSARKPF